MRSKAVVGNTSSMKHSCALIDSVLTNRLGVEAAVEAAGSSQRWRERRQRGKQEGKDIEQVGRRQTGADEGAGQVTYYSLEAYFG